MKVPVQPLFLIKESTVNNYLESYNGIRCILILKGEHSESLMKYTFNNTLLSSVHHEVDGGREQNKGGRAFITLLLQRCNKPLCIIPNKIVFTSTDCNLLTAVPLHDASNPVPVD